MGGIRNIIRRLSHQTSLDSITRAYIGGMVSKPTAAHTALIDVFVKNNKNIIQKADVLYLCNINGTNDSFRNLAKDAHHGTMQGSGLVFDPYWGFSNPDGTGYVDTNYNPATQGVNYQLNDAGLIIYCIENNTAPTGYYIGSITPGSVNTSLRKGTLTTLNSYINSAQVLDTSSIPFQNGLFGGVRTSATEVKNNNQNILTTPTAKVSNAIPSVNIYFFGRNSGNNLADAYRGGLSFIYIGASLTDAEFTQLNNAVNDYLIQCLFLKYGADNWGVKMAKSYFLELHNFDKYEAWEVYEFIKRHQPDYRSGGKELLVNSGTSETTDWVDTNSDGLADSWSGLLTQGNIKSIVTGNGFVGNAQRYQLSTAATDGLYQTTQNSLNIGTTYQFSLKYRSSKKIAIYPFGLNNGSFILNANTGNALYYEGRKTCTASEGQFRVYMHASFDTLVVGDWFEIDEISVKEVTEEGYLYNTFGLNGQNKTIADYIMALKAGGNLNSNAWTKTGAPLMWSQDGYTARHNTMPAYTRRNNLGFITVSSTDGFDGVTVINMRQTYNSVNCFYGNLPRIFGVLKKTGKCRLDLAFGRVKVNLYGQTLAANCHQLYVHGIQAPGGVRVSVADLVGGDYGASVTIVGDRYIYAGYHKLSGDVSLFTTEFNYQLIFGSDKSIYGNLANIRRFPISGLSLADTSISGGTSAWDKVCSGLDLSNCNLTTAAVDAQLSVCDNYYIGSVVPSKVQTVNLGGSSNGIPTNGSNNVNLLSWIAKGAAVGFTPLITVRTV